MTKLKIKPSQWVDLAKYDPADTGDWKGGKEAAAARLEELRAKLDGLQEVLYAGHKERVLMVLQAMDTGGKDGTIRAVFDGINPQGVRVENFKVPTAAELDHDYLWRVHARAPGKGELVVFNRSHYEDVLVVRVHSLVPEAAWKKRYQQINDFERMLAEEGTTILKFFLHITPQEQAERLLERIDTPEKQWKFNPGDLKEREYWNYYMAAYEDALSQTSTEWAPWYVIPANRNWYRNLQVAEILVDTLKKLEMKYPAPAENLQQYRAGLLGK
jgi:PPK2 family polyphosphate:nucleotide phosphotransferase